VKTIAEVIARLRAMRSYCDPECEGRCVECPDTVIGDCARALEAIETPEPPAPQLELFGQPMVERPLSPAAREVWLERILMIYPKRILVKRAREALAVLQPTETLMQTIWAALQWQVKQRDWLKEGGSFAPALPFYITGRRWQDRPPRAFANTSTVSAASAAVDFANGAPCTTPEKNVSGSQALSRRSPSLLPSRKNPTRR
jgi:hypothetical protein